MVIFMLEKCMKYIVHLLEIEFFYHLWILLILMEKLAQKYIML